MITCAMDPAREAIADLAIKAVRPVLPARPKAVRPKKQRLGRPKSEPKHRKSCTRCKLAIIGHVSHATEAECLDILRSRHKMQISIAQRATRARAAEEAKTREWRLKAEAANELLRESQAREKALSRQAERLETALGEMESATKEAQRELREKARAIETVGQKIARLNVQVGGMRRSG